MRYCSACNNSIEEYIVYDEIKVKTRRTRKKCYSCSAYKPLLSPITKNKNRNKKRKEDRILLKKNLIAEKGGKCVICNYSNNIAALEFHHLDPNVKDFGLAVSKIPKKLFGSEKLKQELEKCILVCCRCHREIHNPNSNL